MLCGRRPHGEPVKGGVAGLTQRQQRLLMVAFLGPLGVPGMLATCVHAVRHTTRIRRAAMPCCELSHGGMLSAPPGLSTGPHDAMILLQVRAATQTRLTGGDLKSMSVNLMWTSQLAQY